ncbi:MAG: NAD+ synthase [Acidobacteria bacterium]|nr:NAD+ synthase [Acidobacteriota bacterium]
MRLALLQINPTVGALDANADAIIAAAMRVAPGTDLCITPELALCGYPPRDLLLQRAFVARVRQVLDRVAEATRQGPPLLVGLPLESPQCEGRPLVNAAALLQQGRVVTTCTKSLLPTYDVFDEDRYFEPGRGVAIIDVAGQRCAVSICEDIWNDRDFWQRPRYHRDPIEEAREAGASVVLNLSASPFEVGKQRVRERLLSALASKHGMPIAYVNQVGGNDDLVFDGRSTVVDARGRIIARGAAFREDVVAVELDDRIGAEAGTDETAPEAEVYGALVLGTRDYARKCGFTRVLVGLSGGIDSALTAAIAAAALGPDRVLGVMMPSPFSSAGSIDDSVALAGACGIETMTLPIAPIMAAFDAALDEAFAGRPRDVTEENIQARIRGNLLMALSNKTNALLLTTGNKSELAVGYCTLYGDMSGGLAVIADVPKTMVYRVSRWLNGREGREIIPAAILDKAPSAELRPNQTDQDSLPPYDVLDAILERHIEDHLSHDEIVAAGFAPAVVQHVLRLVRVAEFKRKQAAPGLKVTDRAFGTGWRMPIARADWDRRS